MILKAEKKHLNSKQLDIRNHYKDASMAEVVDQRFVNYKGKRITYNQWERM